MADPADDWTTDETLKDAQKREIKRRVAILERRVSVIERHIGLGDDDEDLPDEPGAAQ